MSVVPKCWCTKYLQVRYILAVDNTSRSSSSQCSCYVLEFLTLVYSCYVHYFLQNNCKIDGLSNVCSTKTLRILMKPERSTVGTSICYHPGTSNRRWVHCMSTSFSCNRSSEHDSTAKRLFYEPRRHHVFETEFFCTVAEQLLHLHKDRALPPPESCTCESNFHQKLHIIM